MVAKLEIPEKFMPWMRYAALAELADEGRGLKGGCEKAAQDLRKAEFERRHGIGDPGSDEQCLSDAVEMARSLANLPLVLLRLRGRAQRGRRRSRRNA